MLISMMVIFISDINRVFLRMKNMEFDYSGKRDITNSVASMNNRRN